MDFRNLQLFNDAYDLVNHPADPANETVPERASRMINYFQVMTARYGTKWMDIFIGENTTFEIADPLPVVLDVGGRYKPYLWY